MGPVNRKGAARAGDRPHHEGRLSHVIRQPAQGDLLDPVAGAHEKRAAQQETEVAVFQRGESLDCY